VDYLVWSSVEPRLRVCSYSSADLRKRPGGQVAREVGQGLLKHINETSTCPWTITIAGATATASAFFNSWEGDILIGVFKELRVRHAAMIRQCQHLKPGLILECCPAMQQSIEGQIILHGSLVVIIQDSTE